MKRAAAVLILLCSCSLRAPRSDVSSCSSDQQCNAATANSGSGNAPVGTGANVCFLGECRGHSADLALVSVEVRPTNDSPFAVTQVANLDLRQSVVQNLVLTRLFTTTGVVTQQQDLGDASAVPNASVTFISHAPAIADRKQQIATHANGAGVFAVNLPGGRWDLLIQPPLPLPPFRPAQVFTTGGALPPMVLPSVGSLVRVQGAVSAGGADLSGATLTAIDATGQSISAPAQVASDNTYSLFLPPATTTYFLEVGPPATPSGTAGPAVVETLPNYDQIPGATNVVLPLPDVATLSGTVVDSSGAALASVPVYARSTDDEPWTLARSAITDSNGAFSLVLRGGTYTVEAAPPASPGSPAISPVQKVVVPLQAAADGGVAQGGGIRLVCPSKLHRTGLVLTADGSPAGANYQVTATRLGDPLLTTRSATSTATATGGTFELTGDPGIYRLEITPPLSAGLPRRIVQVTLDPNGPGTLPTVQIDAPLTVVGTVHGTPAGGSDRPVAGAMVNFFGLDSSGSSILLGSALTDQNGSYTCVLPDVANP
jgi:hypothetical protein